VNVWNTVVVKYTSSNQAMEIRVGDTNVYGACVTARTNRVLANTFVGKSAWADPYLSGNIAGLHAIDTVLSETQIAIVIDNIYKRQDASLQCTACSANAVSSIGSTTETNCECLSLNHTNLVKYQACVKTSLLSTARVFMCRSRLCEIPTWSAQKQARMGGV